MRWRILLLLGIVLTACSSETSIDLIAGSESEDTVVVPTDAGQGHDQEPSPDQETASVSTPSPEAVDLLSCADVADVANDVVGQLGPRETPNSRLRGVLYDYSLELPETFAGMWTDRNNGGTVVIAFTDDPAPHLAELNTRSPIENPRPLAERGDFSFNVVQVEYSEVELRSAQRQAAQLANIEGAGVTGVGLGTIRNRVSLDLINPTGDGLKAVELAIDGLPVCVNVEYTPDPPTGPLQIIPAPGESLTLPPGLSTVTWELNPEFPAPSPSDSTIHVLATEVGCSSGRDMGDALRGPEVVETESEVVIAFAVVPLVGDLDCPSNPSTAVTVTLETSLGGRTLRDVVERNG